VYLRNSVRIVVCSGAGKLIVCRYMVAKVDDSLETFASADENCSHATTTVKPKSAPYTSATVVMTGD
jgi:hypothetical protein